MPRLNFRANFSMTHRRMSAPSSGASASSAPARVPLPLVTRLTTFSRSRLTRGPSTGIDMLKILIVGAGINGATAAVELKQRGHDVTLVDPGPIPHPLAASTDISKVIRMEYGTDEDYMELAERAILGWNEWNREFGVDLFHQTGVL